jgi:hypothetical protein
MAFNLFPERTARWTCHRLDKPSTLRRSLIGGPFKPQEVAMVRPRIAALNVVICPRSGGDRVS